MCPRNRIKPSRGRRCTDGSGTYHAGAQQQGDRGTEAQARIELWIRNETENQETSLLLERLNEEIKRRTRVVRIFPNPASCLRLIRTLGAGTHEAWLEDHRDLNMDFLKEQK